MTRVTVIVPAYNASSVLPAALGSLAAQTRPPDEVIVVDDASTDDSAAVARSWAGHLPLRVLSLEENIGRGLGAGPPRNVGIAASTGDVIALLDADDVFLPDHLDVMLTAHAEFGGLITANHLLWSPGRALGPTPASQLVPVPPPEEQWNQIISENFVFIGTVFSRELFDAAGGFASRQCEDWDLWIRMLETGARVHMPAQVTALYRQSSTSVSASDGILGGDISLLTELRARYDGVEGQIIDRALRRRRAKAEFLAGIDAFESGERWAARRHWLRALTADPSLRPNNSKMNGLVGPRALACLLAPATMVGRRQQRQRSASVSVGS